MTKNQKVKTLTYSAFMTAFIIILGFLPGIPIGFIPVPIILQNDGNNDGWGTSWPQIWYNFGRSISYLSFNWLTCFNGWKWRSSELLGPSGGYRMAWLFTPFLIGFSLRNCKLQLQRIGLEN